MGQNGGRRKGAGRPKGAVANVKSKLTAEQILSRIGEEATWSWALATAKKKKDAKTVVDILKYLTDRRDGKPKQALEGTGEGGKMEMVVTLVGDRAKPTD